MNLDLHPASEASALRKLALGTWRAPRDPSAYASLEVRMEPALEFMASHRTRTGRRLTVTHLVAKAAADALHRYPEANVVLRGHRPWLREDVGVCVLVVQPAAGASRVDLTTATVHRADEKSLEALADAMEARVSRVRAREDVEIERGKRRSSLLPGWLMGPALRLLSFVWYGLNVDLRRVGMPFDPFGSVAVTNLGSLGLEQGFVAMVPYTRVPLLLAPGRVRDVPVVQDGALVPGKAMTLTCTWDARLIDVDLAARVLRHIGGALEDPRGWDAPGAEAR